MSDPILVKPVTIPKYILYPAWIVVGVFVVLMLVNNPLAFLFIAALSIVLTTTTPAVYFITNPVDKPAEEPQNENTDSTK